MCLSCSSSTFHGSILHACQHPRRCLITILQATQPAGPHRCHSQQCLQETQLPEATARAAAEAQPAPAYPFFHADPRRTLRRASSRLAGLLKPRRMDLAAPQQPSPACCSPERSVLGSCCSAGRRLLLDEPCSSRQASPRQSAEAIRLAAAHSHTSQLPLLAPTHPLQMVQRLHQAAQSSTPAARHSSSSSRLCWIPAFVRQGL